jgi:ribonucleotide reductase beta subunit family protein with ferritin-like domain
MSNTEPILTEDPTRFCLFPIKYPDIWEEYKRQERSYWTAEEIQYASDLKDWKSLSNDERFFIENILAFFAGSDGIVLENLVTNFCNEVKIPEARCAYSFQAMMENTHSFVYSLLIDTLVKEPKKKKKLFEAVVTIPCVKEKADWAIKWMNKNERCFAERLIAFAVVEGVFFSGSFCAIFWLKSRGKMCSALGTSNQWISRDEGMHTDFAVLLFSKLKNKPEQLVVENIFREAVEIETKFITESLPCRLIGMNSDLMGKYIKFVADRLITQLGYKKIYNETNPFSFMETLGLQGKTNFFEHEVTEYQSASHLNHNNPHENVDDFSLDEDF